MAHLAVAHIYGIPVEETLLSAFPVVAVVAGIALQRLGDWSKLVRRLRFRRVSGQK